MNDSQTLLALDHGNKITGVARVDTFVKIVEPLADFKTEDKDALESLITEHQPSAVIIGLPRGLEGQETDQTRIAREFAQMVGDKYDVAVHLQDEALTSVGAEGRQPGVSEHSLAAATILEDYMRENL